MKEKIIKIYSIASWDICNLFGVNLSEHDRLRRFSPNCSGRWNNIELCDSFDDADFYTVFWPDKTGLRKKCRPKSVINLMREPSIRIPPKSEIGVETITSRVVTDDYNPQGWWVGKTYSELNEKPFPRKSKLVSHITTGASALRGHKLRLSFLRRFTGKHPSVLKLYGKNKGGFDLRKIGCYRGPVMDKWDALAPYRYAFAFNNVHERNYFDEKLVDVILAGCMPIYWGCPNIGDFFPKGSYVYLDIEREDAVEKAMKIINSDYRERNLDALKRAKDLILNKYQFWPTVHKIINNLIKARKIKWWDHL